MSKRIRAVLAPDVIVAATAGAAGSRARDSGSGRRLDELSKGRPAAAPHFPVDGALAAASQAATEALEAQRAQSRKAPARTGRGGGGRSCDPESIVQRESNGNPNAVNPSSGAGGKYQFLPSTWSGYGGYARADDAPESVQDERFNEMWAGGAGSSHWGC
jgi:Transglycosylase-like domain